MANEINLEVIWNQVEKDSRYGMNKGEQLKAMKEACRQVLMLAAENAKIKLARFDNDSDEVDKQSIIKTIDQVK
jgi:hypothetical protein